MTYIDEYMTLLFYLPQYILVGGGNTEIKIIAKEKYTINDTKIKVDGSRIRKLTPKECWRLMGFTDEDFEKAEKVNSNTQLYKQAGNSIVVNVLEAILSQLFPQTETDIHRRQADELLSWLDTI